MKPYASHKRLLPRAVKNLIEEVGFALFLKLGLWLEARIPSKAARVVLGLLLGLAAIASIVTVTAIAGF